MRVTTAFWLAAAALAKAAYWMEDVPHQGISAYHPDPNYQVFRNVRDFGAKGDGVTDDTAAINLAISSGQRCGPGTCKGETTSPATVYFPPGTYLISGSIIDYFYTQIIGDPNDRPVIKAAADFPTNTTLGLLDGNQYGANGLAWGATNVFFRQIRNLVFDTTAIPASAAAYAIHWPSSQATAITNCAFYLAEGPDSKHIGLFIEEGSGGLLNDLEFHGGLYGASFGNQQYTLRGASFFNAQVAINQIWDWGWTYKSIYIENCAIGIRMQDTGTSSITLIDSDFVDVETAIHSSRDPGASVPTTAGTLVMENVGFVGVNAILRDPQNNTIIPGSAGSVRSQGFAMGHIYTPTGPTDYTGDDASYFPVYPALQGASSTGGTKYYERSKPHYADLPAINFISARAFGAAGDGSTDDTVALNNLLNYVTANPSANLVAFVDAGTYYVSDTVFIPPGARVVGEALASIIMGGGAKFQDITNPHPVVKVGLPGQCGTVEWSDMIVSTRGPAPGAKVIEYNLNSLGEPAGMWDVHVRVGGFAGTQQQLAQCPTTPEVTITADTVDANCIAAFMSMHMTKSSSNLFMENCWLWVADHDLEDPNYTQVTIYAGRGLLVESTNGRIWLSASGSEHHTLYQYQLVNTRDVYMGQVQSETPYYQPNPVASIPFPRVEGYHDPDFEADCRDHDPSAPPCEMAWGLRVVASRNVVAFGAGHYSFFNNYSTACCQIGAGARCQQRIVDIRDGPDGDATPSVGVEVYNLQIVGTTAMVTRDGTDVAFYRDNIAGFTAGIALYQH
ncbi:glucan 1,3-beta-glucosidase [Colletotrichum graminicola M1.001]|uniref:Glucan 1,3-beta-glucosidase n=1 Tax=Colletotrichum graminicola (strain M1.001 / M2 / FGSC 10212) TaxID=645133 RepID=E3QP04_COLGM|nr:glucan 1,3-beta-glucosidase [Colletotrichum graminicola M1.001]EFQ32592.1 glucan 1,3-beta-glucosidase [Colletotrichum graminicola M1.001]